ncbi:MAG: molybdopterin dinucleotide binding domain-containing protein [candidate division WOR-3 bacterium]
MSELRKTVCPLCLNGCRVGVRYDGYQYQIEYLTNLEPNYGRLCPRGNSANIVLDHPKRLCYPLLDGKEITWERAFDLIQEWRSQCSSEEIAVVYSRGLQDEEIKVVYGMADALGMANIVCGYLEPGNYFWYQLEGVKQAKLEDITASRATLLVGDIFSTSPVAAKPILEARYADKTSRLIVIDSIKTKQAGFAHIFIQVKPGTEFLALLAIAGILDPNLRIDIDDCVKRSGVQRNIIEQVAQILKNTESGFVGASICFGRVDNPLLFSLCVQLVALKANKPFTGFTEALVPEGKISFGKLREKISQGKIKMLFWFGGLFPYSYPEVFPEMNNVRFRVASSIFRPANPLPGLVLPVPSEYEKEGRAETLWGEVRREPIAQPVSGTKPLSEIIKRIAGKEIQPLPLPERKRLSVAEVLQNAEGGMRKAECGRRNAEGDGFLLLGEKPAFGVGGFFDQENKIAINPADAHKLNVKEGEWVMVKSRTGELSFQCDITTAVPEGMVSVGVNNHKNRALFRVEVDEKTGIVTIPPTKVEIWRA